MMQVNFLKIAAKRFFEQLCCIVKTCISVTDTTKPVIVMHRNQYISNMQCQLCYKC